MFTGAYQRTIDEKLRIAAPKKLRDALPAGQDAAVYLAPGTDGSLAVYPELAFEQLAGQIDRLSPTGRDVRAFSRLFYSQAQRVEFDKQGRFRIPAELAKLAGLEREVVLLGVRDHWEIWDCQRWRQYIESQCSEYDQIAENAFRSSSPSHHDE